MNRILSVLLLVVWISYLFCDFYLLDELEKAISSADATYGELYGPASFFHPYLKYGATVLLMFFVITPWIKRKK